MLKLMANEDQRLVRTQAKKVFIKFPHNKLKTENEQKFNWF